VAATTAPAAVAAGVVVVEEVAAECAITGRAEVSRSTATIFDSNGPDIRVRGTAQQLFEKYLQLGRDATSGGDRVMAEGYLQYAEHYFRVLNLMNQAAAQQGQGGGQGNGQAGSGQMNGHQGGGQQRYRQGYQNGEEAPQASSAEPEEAEIRAPGMGDQPEAREIPITTTPPEE